MNLKQQFTATLVLKFYDCVVGGVNLPSLLGLAHTNKFLTYFDTGSNKMLKNFTTKSLNFITKKYKNTF
jgi:hypothetical protein